MKNYSLIKILIFILLNEYSGVLFSQDITFNSFLGVFRIDTLPFNSFKINSDNEFINHKKKYKIPKSDIIKYLIKDTSELGYKYFAEAMDNNNKKEMYYETRFYAYCRFSIISNYYLVIYNKENSYNSDFYLNIYDKSGFKIVSYQLTGDGMDTYFFASEVDVDLSIKKVTYTFIEDNKTKIDIENYSFDLGTKGYKLIKHKTIYTSHFYGEYEKHKLDDDPFKIVEKK